MSTELRAPAVGNYTEPSTDGDSKGRVAGDREGSRSAGGEVG
jgi:hypothetical protein